jgi:hypothetical protein
MWTNVIGVGRSWSFRLLLIVAGFCDWARRSIQQQKEDQSNNQKEVLRVGN